MSDSGVPSSDPWLERSRLDGMVLDGFTYGIFFLLSIEACVAVWKGGKSARVKLSKRQAYFLIAYVVLTFTLGSMGFAANARYTEDIWINFRGGDRDPSFLITNEFDYWYNRLAIDTNFVMVWFMNLLLLYRCCVIWNYQFLVVALMSAVYLAIISLSIAVMISASNSAVFFNLNIQLSFLVLSCTYNLLFTILVTIRLLAVRNRITALLGPEHAVTYTSITATLVESASLYFIFDVIFVVTFATHSNVENLILLENCLIQGIAQLLIIKRVAKGREYDTTMATHVASTGIAFNRHGPGGATTTINIEEDGAIAVPMTARKLSGKKDVSPNASDDSEAIAGRKEGHVIAFDIPKLESNDSETV
ncbi:hypothetical protein MSAN_02512800 [Mycena sanguinolenta]|uniref:Uncharacterized protein n=1 Tax=Mycena sanguinolenta TaxID=230812 RepID=A0A8H6U2U7_9AGAR|nr:hypothetical protein MSAN_02512800 [Mycena sanguinolenta]